MKVCFNSNSLYNNSLRYVRNGSEKEQNANDQCNSSNLSFGNSFPTKKGMRGAIIIGSILALGVTYSHFYDKAQIDSCKKIILEKSGSNALDAVNKKAAGIKGPFSQARKCLTYTEAARQAVIKSEHAKKPHIPHIKNPLLKKGRIR